MGRIMIAGTNSGCGKTTVTCAILATLKKREINVTSFKCGPEYIDPAFQKEVLDIDAYNLDSFMMKRNTIKYLVNEHSKDMAVIDGVKGYYDGLQFTTTASTNEMSVITKTPTILVVDCNGMETSAAAVMQGFIKYKSNTIKGVIFNRLKSSLYEGMKKLCEELKIKCFGYIPQMKSVAVENKNLALVTSFEIDDKKSRLIQVAEQVEKTLDIDGIIALSEETKKIKCKPIEIPFVGKARIAVSSDKAFCFNYKDNMELLEKMGAEIVYFSPLTDKALPENSDGLILTGGYPEMFCDELSKNKSMLESIKEAVQNGLPTIAECGGFMYLHEKMQDIKGMQFKMAGVIEGNCMRSVPQPENGYVELIAEEDNLLLKKGEKIRTYEFHRYESSNPGSSLLLRKNGEEWHRIHATKTLYAGFPHLHFYSNIATAENFMKACIQ